MTKLINSHQSKVSSSVNNGCLVDCYYLEDAKTGKMITHSITHGNNGWVLWSWNSGKTKTLPYLNQSIVDLEIELKHL